MILDAPRIDPPDWSHDHRVIVPASRRTVWEVSVRDFSQDPACGVRNAWRGKFMAFTQKGTTLASAGTFPTCLDYLKRLGVGYVQLMPIFDFGSVDAVSYTHLDVYKRQPPSGSATWASGAFPAQSTRRTLPLLRR